MQKTEKKIEFGPYPGRYQREMISECKALEATIREYTKRGQPLPMALHVQVPKLKALKSSLMRMGITV